MPRIHESIEFFSESREVGSVAANQIVSPSSLAEALTRSLQASDCGEKSISCLPDPVVFDRRAQTRGNGTEHRPYLLLIPPRNGHRGAKLSCEFENFRDGSNIGRQTVYRQRFSGQGALVDRRQTILHAA